MHAHSCQPPPGQDQPLGKVFAAFAADVHVDRVRIAIKDGDGATIQGWDALLR